MSWRRAARAQGRRAALVLATCIALLAGCLETPANDATNGNADSSSQALDLPAPQSPPVSSTACYGYNAFAMTDAAAITPHIPSNWSVSGPPPDQSLATLRIHVVGCADEWRLMLSTPVVPDAASEIHHANPDHILGVYTNNESRIDEWATLGVLAVPATIEWNEQPPSHDHIVVTTPAGLVLDITLVDPRQPQRGAYAFWATYSSGPGPVAWFNAHENATTRPSQTALSTFGSAAPFGAIDTAPWVAETWLGFDVQYKQGPGTH